MITTATLAPISEIPGQSNDGSITHITDAAGFFALEERSNDAVILNRQMPQSVRDWLDGMPPDALPSGRFVLRPEHVGRCLADAFTSTGITANPAMHWLCNDVQALAHRVMDIVQSPFLRFRIEPIFDNGCSKFHIDTVHARLLCTYRGPGTELRLANDRSESPLQVITGHPVLLKGKLWPQSNVVKLKHRSPPIEGTGLCRWLVVLEGATLDDDLSPYDQLYPGPA